MSKCGYVTIIGKTNVGKSTFLNKFLGKKVSIAVFAQGKAAEDAKVAGAKHVGGEDLVTILEKKIDVDVIVATPDMMSVVSKIAKILGPKGLMPNPKTGTVTNLSLIHI